LLVCWLGGGCGPPCALVCWSGLCDLGRGSCSCVGGDLLARVVWLSSCPCGRGSSCCGGEFGLPAVDPAGLVRSGWRCLRTRLLVLRGGVREERCLGALNYHPGGVVFPEIARGGHVLHSVLRPERWGCGVRKRIGFVSKTGCCPPVGSPGKFPSVFSVGWTRQNMVGAPAKMSCYWPRGCGV